MRSQLALCLGTFIAGVAVVAPCQAQEDGESAAQDDAVAPEDPDGVAPEDPDGVAPEDPDGVAQDSRPGPDVAQQPQPEELPPPPPPPVAYRPSGAEPSIEGGYAPRAGWNTPAMQGSTAPHLREPRFESRWYGWQTLMVDGAAILIASDVSVPIYVLGGPIVHWSHGNVGRGFGSLGLRVGAPLLLAAAFVSGCDGDGDMGCLGEALIGLLLGSGAAIAIDAAVIARDTVEVEDEVSFSLGPARVTPTVGITDSQGRVMLVGTF